MGHRQKYQRLEEIKAEENDVRNISLIIQQSKQSCVLTVFVKTGVKLR